MDVQYFIDEQERLLKASELDKEALKYEEGIEDAKRIFKNRIKKENEK